MLCGVPGVSGMEMKIYERLLQAHLSSARCSRVLARLAPLAQIGKLAHRLLMTCISDCVVLPHCCLKHGLYFKVFDF